MAAAKPMFSDESASDSGSGSGSSSSSSSSDSDSKAKAKEDSSKNVVSGKPTDTFTVNRQYAERFEHNKRREETHRLAEKVKREYIIRPGDIGEDSDSDTSSSESDEGDVPVKFDTQFAKALLRIKNKDPAIYDEEKALFSDDDDDDVDEAKKKRKKKRPKSKPCGKSPRRSFWRVGLRPWSRKNKRCLRYKKPRLVGRTSRNRRI